MKTSSRHGWDKAPTKAQRVTLSGALGISIALGALIATCPLQAEGAQHGNRQHGAARAPHEAYRHDDNRRGGNYSNGGYENGYMAPPVVYAPEQEPGISLVLPL